MSRDVLDIFAESAHERHGYDVVALDMSQEPLPMEVFLIVSAENRIQCRAISDHLERTGRKHALRTHHREGYDEGSWILLDFIDLVIHIFIEDTRNYYNLEMLWSDVPKLKFEDRKSGGDKEYVESDRDS